jgi:hypothetical protein
MVEQAQGLEFILDQAAGKGRANRTCTTRDQDGLG